MIWCKIFGHKYDQVYLTAGHFVNSFCSRCGDYRTHMLQDAQFDCPGCGESFTVSSHKGADGTSYNYFARELARLSELLEEVNQQHRGATAAADGSETE